MVETNAFGSYASAAGSVAQVVGGIFQAIQAQQLGEYNAQVAAYNAQAEGDALEIEALQQERLGQLSEYDLLLSQRAADYRARQITEEVTRLQGTARARIGASGLAFAGSPLAVLEENARQGEEALLANRYRAALEQRAIREDITQRTYAATLARFGAGERLRLGRQQSGLAQFSADITSLQGVNRAFGSAAQGASLFAYQQQQAER